MDEKEIVLGTIGVANDLYFSALQKALDEINAPYHVKTKIWLLPSSIGRW